MTRKVIAAKRRSRNEVVEDPRIDVAVLILRKMFGSLREVEPKAS